MRQFNLFRFRCVSLQRFQLVLPVLLIVFLCQCNSVPFSNGPSSNGRSSEVTLKLSTWGSAQEITTLKELLNQFEQTHPHIHVSLLHIPENYYQKLHLLIAGDMAPDVMLTNNLSFPIYASQGIFLDLKPFFDTRPFYPAALKAFTWHRENGQDMLGALPRDISDLVVFYNKDLLNQAGLPEPSANWTWATFLDMARRLTIQYPGQRPGESRPRQFGFSFYATPPLYWLPFVWSASGALLSPDLQQFMLTQPQAVQGLTFYADLRNRWHVAPTKVETGGVTMTQLFLQQKLAMMLSGRWIVPVLRQQAQFHWDVAPFPIGPSGQSRVGIDASGYAISATSPHRLESLALLRFLVSRQAIEVVTRSGLIVPARPDVADSPIFLSKKEAPQHAAYFLTALTHGVPTQTPPRWNEFSEVLGLALEPVWDGQQDPASAMAGVKAQLQPLLTMH